MAEPGAVIAAVLYLGGAVVLFGVRSWRQWRTTGSTGFKGFAPNRGGWARLAGVFFVLALLMGLAAPVLAAVGMIHVIDLGPVVRRVLGVCGLLLSLAGFGAAALSQTRMGRSWRIGVDPAEVTDLVTGGVFGWVRNPIFTAMTCAAAGTVLMAPTWLGLAGAVLLGITCELQVRRVEEPYLARTHPHSYPAYAERVGRFLPGIGRLATEPDRVRTPGATR